jgi:hypothetical protein
MYVSMGAMIMTDGTARQHAELVLRPLFIGWATVLAQIPHHLVFAVLALNAGAFLGAAMTEPSDRAVSYSYFLFPPALVLAVSPLLSFHLRRRRYRQKEYRFFGDRLQLGDGYVFFYRDVESVTISRGLLGRMTGLGTIRLNANIEGLDPLFAKNGRGVVTRRGIILKDILDPEEALVRIQALIDGRPR